MKIVILTVWYSEKMGYIENCLPKALAKLGHEVHVISSVAQVYYNEPDYKKIYEPYLGKNILETGVKNIDGFKLHRLSFGLLLNKIYLKGLKEKLQEINPDVVQVFDGFSFLTLQGAYYKLLLGYKFFTANHTVASVFPLIQNKKSPVSLRLVFFITRTLPGRIISWVTSRCYPATIDALDIAVKYYGIPEKKVKLAFLGVDTDFFHHLNQNEEEKIRRRKKRQELGYDDNDILCIYTGRFTEGKNPLCLSQAIEKLGDRGEPFKALFMGNGPQSDEIKTKKGCLVHRFVPYHELPLYYAIADIGVWPKQESTSMIDAAACGLPIIISDKVQAKERVEGNGLTYIENDSEDLAQKLLQMKDREVREKFGMAGIEKVRNRFSWNKIARDRIKDYDLFVQKK